MHIQNFVVVLCWVSCCYCCCFCCCYCCCHCCYCLCVCVFFCVFYGGVSFFLICCFCCCLLGYFLDIFTMLCVCAVFYILSKSIICKKEDILKTVHLKVCRVGFEISSVFVHYKYTCKLTIKDVAAPLLVYTRTLTFPLKQLPSNISPAINDKLFRTSY